MMNGKEQLEKQQSILLARLEVLNMLLLETQLKLRNVAFELGKISVNGYPEEGNEPPVPVVTIRHPVTGEKEVIQP